jgi:inner membrane protein
MDNLTHSVVGLAVGEFLHRSLPEETGHGRRPQPHSEHGRSIEESSAQRTRHRLLLFTCWAASNFPDLDLVLTPLLPSPLGYLLHHRGHTHTLLYALPQALLLALLIWMSWPAARALLKQSATARKGFFIALAAGFMLHMAMDFLNSYGIHPFHPFDSRWFYGDLVFILEPVFWMAFGMPLIMAMPGRALKLLFMALLAGVPVYFSFHGFLHWASLASLIVIATVTALLQRRAGTRGKGALLASMAIGAGFVLVQQGTLLAVRATVAGALHSEGPDNMLVDAAMTAFPSNPLCWTFVTVESNEAAGKYILRSGTASAAPGIMPVNACPPGFASPGARLHGTGAIALSSRQDGDLELLRKLKSENCHVEAWLRFARAPYVNGEVAYDARYETSQRGNFTTMELQQFRDQPCAASIPQWAFPRADMLSAPSK